METANLIPREAFPHLWDVLKAPLCLWYQGREESLKILDRLPKRGLAVIGARDPLQQSLREVERWIRSFRERDLVVLSGFAKGIDQKAHTEAVDAGIPTVAIIGAGLDIDYPTESSRIRQRIIDSGGLIVSEFPNGTPAHAGNFPKRNRLIAGWAKAVWVVEAGARSGTLNTARWARDQDVDCYATPCHPEQTHYSGNQKLLEEQEAYCFWNPKSLGHTWKEFASWKEKCENQKIKDPSACLFRDVLAEKSRAHGAASIEQMISWAANQGWPPSQTLGTLKLCLDSGWIVDHGGLLSVPGL